MTIRVHNTLTREKETFEPVTPGKVGIYVCGPTVYKESHVGHMVGPVLFDTIKRYLAYNHYDVTMVINVTDVDDKIIAEAAKQGVPWDTLAKKVTKDYQTRLSELGVEVDHFPHATAYIEKMLAMIQGLVDKGHAYPAGGDVYFDVTTKADYGKLSNRKLDEMLAGSRKEVSDLKRNAGDFALWKGVKPGEPAWESPWGPGRPGWHIECSAMSMNLLGETFDIHGGGLDLCFPHHEDEIAQSECFSGKVYAKYWLHNGLMQLVDATRKIGARAGDFDSQEEGKMSKSKGNVVGIADLMSRFTADEIRFFLISTHYRSPILFSEERLKEVGSGIQRLYTFAELYQRVTGSSFYESAAPAKREPLPFAAEGAFLTEVASLRDRFLEHMDDDFNTGGAIGVLSEFMSLVNRFAAEQKLETKDATAADKEAFVKGASVLRELTAVLGLLLKAPKTAGSDDSGLTGKLLDLMLELRQLARKEKNFAFSDTIRNRLADLGVTVQDGPEGSRWKIG